MQTTTVKKTVLYSLLLGVSVVLMFPFYWVVISSVKTADGVVMSPPLLYPGEYRKVDLKLAADNSVVVANNQRWFRLANSVDLSVPQANEPGAYYVRLDDNGAPSKLSAWWPDREVTLVASTKPSIRFSDSQVVSLLSDERELALLARMLRQKDGGLDELLFAAEMVAEGGTTTDIEILKNVDYKRTTGWKVRFENFPETLRGPEAAYGEKSPGFLTFLRNSFFISTMAVIGQIFSSSLVAFAFARLQFKGREVLFVLLLATMMIPGQVTLLPLFAIYKSLGWIDSFLPLIVPHFMAGAFNVFLMRQYMLTLPKELDESAQMDGCGPLRTYFFVILPNCVPVLIVVGLFTFVATWQDVLGPLIYLDNPEYRTVTLGLEYFRVPTEDTLQLLMTGALLAMLPVAILFLFFQRYIISGVATSGLKG